MKSFMICVIIWEVLFYHMILYFDVFYDNADYDMYLLEQTKILRFIFLLKKYIIAL